MAFRPGSALISARRCASSGITLMRASRLKPLMATMSAVPAQLLETTRTSWVGLPSALALAPADAVAGSAIAPISIPATSRPAFTGTAD